MNSQVRVRVFFPGYPNTFKAICDTWKLKKYQYKHIKFVNDESYTHAIIINFYSDKVKLKIKENIPKQNILGLAWEPPRFLKKDKCIRHFIERRVGNYLIGARIKGFPKEYVPHYGFITHIPVQNKPEKTNFMSIILSNKKITDGHKYRHELVESILKTDLNIHIYGRGADHYKDDRVKGEFNSEEPYKSYTFTIAIENIIHNHYISEKYTSSIALNCIPIYLGCRNISKYFGNDSYVKLTGKVDEDITLLQDIFTNKEKYLKNLDTARNHILNGNASLPVFLSKYWKKK